MLFSSSVEFFYLELSIVRNYVELEKIKLFMNQVSSLGLSEYEPLVICRIPEASNPT